MNSIIKFLKSGAGFIARPTSSRTMGLLAVLVLVSAVSLTVIVAQQQQSIKQQAYNASCDDVYNEGKATCSADYSACANECPASSIDYSLDVDVCISECNKTQDACNGWADDIYSKCTSRTSAPTPKCSSLGGTCLATNKSCSSLGNYVPGGYGSEYCSDIGSPVCCVPAPTSTPTTAPASNTFILSGHVFIDTDKNGELNNGERYYDGATLTLSTADGLINNVNRSETIVTGQWSRTATAGSYTLTLTIPSGYKATTPTSISIASLSANKTDLNFGIVSLTQNPTSTPTPTPTRTPIPSPTGTITPTPTKTPTLPQAQFECVDQTGTYAGNYACASIINNSPQCPSGYVPFIPGTPTSCTDKDKGRACCKQIPSQSPTPSPTANNVTLVMALNAQDTTVSTDSLPVNLTLYNLLTNSLVNGAPKTHSFAKTPIPGKQYSANISLTNLPEDRYFLVVRKDNMIAKSIFTVSGSGIITVPTTTLVFGDLNNDNDINTVDYYTVFKACWNKPATGSCVSSDFNNNGVVDQVDSNTFLRGFETWRKEGKKL